MNSTPHIHATPTPTADIPSALHSLGQTAQATAQVLSSSLRLAGRVIGNAGTLVQDVVVDSQHVARDAVATYHAAAVQVEQVREVWRATPRVTRIVSEATKLVAGYKLHEFKAPFMAPAAQRQALEELHARSAHRLYDMCVELRGGVLKLGQLLSCRVDVLPAVYIQQLAQLQDQAPHEEPAAISAMIEQDLGRPVHELFAQFEMVPVAAASLAQVHRAVLTDGSVVAVKVQRPGIREILEADITALRMVAGLLRSMMPAMDADTFVNEIARSLLDEIDFAAEATAAAQFAQQLGHRDDVLIARSYPELSSARVLTMDYIEGQRIQSYLDGCAAAGVQGRADIDRLLHTLVDVFMEQILRLGHFHADPHPGNFMVTAQGKLVMLDFGCVCSFTPETRRRYLTLCLAALGNNRPEMQRLLDELGFRAGGDDPGAMLKYCDLMLEEFRAGATLDFASIDIRAKVQQAMELTRQSPITHVPADFVMLGRVFAALSGLVVGYRPSLDLAATAMPYLMEAVAAG